MKHLSRSRAGRFAAGMVAVVAACTVAGMVLLPGAQAQKVANPGTFSLAPINGSMRIGTQVFDLTPRPLPQCGDGIDNDGDGLVDTADAGCSVVGAPGGSTVGQDDSELAGGFQPKVDVTITGTIDGAGNISVPQSGVVFPPAYVPVLNPLDGITYVVTAKVIPTAAATGILDPISGSANLQVKLRVGLTGAPAGVDLGATCSIGSDAVPLTLNLTTGSSGGAFGTRYNTTTGQATMIDAAFTVPGATGCPIGLLNLNDIINQQMKIPSPSGQNLASIKGQTTPVFAKGIVARISTTPGQTSGPAPLDLSFDAGTSEVAKGPATYLWTFPDGTTQSGLTAQKTFTQPGTYVVTLTVTDGDGDKATVTKGVSVTTGSTTVPTTAAPTTAAPTTAAPTTAAPTTAAPTTAAPTTAAPTTAAPTTAAPTTAAPTTAAPTTTPPGSPDRASVTVSGRTAYANSGTATSGGVTVVRDEFGIVSARGRITLPSTGSGSATVAVDAQRVWILPLWTGQVSVSDPGASVSVTAPIFGQVHPSAGVKAAQGSSSWFTLGQFPDLFQPFAVTWSVDDVS
ncbi:MAG: PKD domain-containing protein [Microthrixaceae bacterium]|nr:PKD domain-containing protein [Microthrixaceae bacterium]